MKKVGIKKIRFIEEGSDKSIKVFEMTANELFLVWETGRILKRNRKVSIIIKSKHSMRLQDMGKLKKKGGLKEEKKLERG